VSAMALSFNAAQCAASYAAKAGALAQVMVLITRAGRVLRVMVLLRWFKVKF